VTAAALALVGGTIYAIPSPVTCTSPWRRPESWVVPVRGGTGATHRRPLRQV